MRWYGTIFTAALLAAFTFSLAGPAASPAGAAAPWLESETQGGIAYFLYASPPRIERYDMAGESWLPDLTLAETPGTFAVDGEGIYVSFGRRTSRFTLEGTGELHLQNMNNDVRELATVGNHIYLYDWDLFKSVDKTTGILIDSADLWYGMTGLDVAPARGKAFGRSGGSPSDIVQLVLNADGTLGEQDDSPYHGDYPSASRTYVFPGEARVADDSGTVYNTNDLTYSNSLGGRFDDLDFYGNLPVVLREGTLHAYSNAFLETGSYTPAMPPQKIFVYGESLFSFYEAGTGVVAEKLSIDLLEPDTPGQPVDPKGLAYLPDAVHLGQDETLYILSRGNLSIFPWSLSERSYLETIPLAEAPTHMAYSAVNDTIYLGYPSGKISQIGLGGGSVVEEPLLNVPQGLCGLAAAGEFPFVCGLTQYSQVHLTYDSEGTLLSESGSTYRSQSFAWNDVNRRIYFIRENVTPRDLHWEEIGVDGQFGASLDSPYHSSAGMIQPVRVAPDGSVVVLGSGRIYDAITLEQTDTLSNDISDAAWSGGGLYTIRPAAPGTEIQRWTASYGVGATRGVEGSPQRLISVPEGLLLMTDLDGVPWFSIWGEELGETYQLPIAGFMASPALGAAPLEVRFTDSSHGGTRTASLWDFGDGSDSTEGSPVHLYTTPGTYSVTLTVTGPSGSDSVTERDLVTVLQPPPVADFTVDPAEGSAPLTVHFSNTSDWRANTVSLWDFGDGSTSTVEHPYHTYEKPGAYTVELTVAGPRGADRTVKENVVTVLHPLWPDAVDLGGGWKSSWFGYVNDPSYPWLFHNELGWLYCTGEGPSSAWFWNPVLGWMWTSRDVFPSVYMKGYWYWYLEGSADPALFYNFSSGEWEGY